MGLVIVGVVEATPLALVVVVTEERVPFPEVIDQETVWPITRCPWLSFTVIDKGVVKASPAVAVNPAPTGLLKLDPVAVIQVIAEGELKAKLESVTSVIVKVDVPVMEVDLTENVATPKLFVVDGDVVIVSPV
jgi:hypothetical protein